MKKPLETILASVILTAAATGLTNEITLKNPYLRNILKVSCAACLVPYIINDEYRRHKTNS